MIKFNINESSLTWEEVKNNVRAYIEEFFLDVLDESDYNSEDISGDDVELTIELKDRKIIATFIPIFIDNYTEFDGFEDFKYEIVEG